MQNVKETERVRSGTISISLKVKCKRGEWIEQDFTYDPEKTAGTWTARLAMICWTSGGVVEVVVVAPVVALGEVEEAVES